MGGESENYEDKYDHGPKGFKGAGDLVLQFKMAVNRIGRGNPGHAEALAAYEAFLLHIGWKRRDGLTTERSEWSPTTIRIGAEAPFTACAAQRGRGWPIAASSLN